MSHDTLAVLFTILLGLISFLATIAFQDIRKRLVGVEGTQRLHLTVLYHLATATPIPEEVKEQVTKAMMNGKRLD